MSSSSSSSSSTSSGRSTAVLLLSAAAAASSALAFLVGVSVGMRRRRSGSKDGHENSKARVCGNGNGRLKVWNTRAGVWVDDGSSTTLYPFPDPAQEVRELHDEIAGLKNLLGTDEAVQVDFTRRVICYLGYICCCRRLGAACRLCVFGLSS